MSSWYFVKRKRRSDIGQKHKPRSLRPDKSRGAWVTSPCGNGVEFRWDPNAVPADKTVRCPNCGSKVAVEPSASLKEMRAKYADIITKG